MPNNEKDYGFGRTTVEGNDGWYPTKQKPTTSSLYPYNHIDDLINEKLEQHLRRTDNPHQVTLQQLNANRLFAHSMVIEQESGEDVAKLKITLLDLDGLPIADIPEIEIDLAQYAKEQLEELKQEIEAELEELETKIIEDIEPQIEQLREEIQQIISELSIEELSKRDYYDPDEDPDDRYELVTDSNFDPEKHYYKEVYDVDSTKLYGMWSLKAEGLNATNFDELNELLDGGASFWWNVHNYWYNNGVKKSFSRIGVIEPTPTPGGAWTKGQDLYGFGLTDTFYTGENWGYGAISSLSDIYRGVIALPVRHTRDYDFSSETGYKDVDYNPLGDTGLYPSTFKIVYFDNTLETETSRTVAELMNVLSEKVSDELLDNGDTNYKTKFVPVILTEETYEPNKYYIRKDLPIPKVTRIELGEDSSTYRDSLGNDVLKIVKNNVLLNGDKLAPDLKVVTNTQTEIELENNSEKTFSNTINNLTITIPDTVKHGFTSYIVLEPSASFSANIINNSSFKPLRIIKAGSTVSTLDFEPNCQYNLLFLCNGVKLELYVQEIVIE